MSYTKQVQPALGYFVIFYKVLVRFRRTQSGHRCRNTGLCSVCRENEVTSRMRPVSTRGIGASLVLSTRRAYFYQVQNLPTNLPGGSPNTSADRKSSVAVGASLAGTASDDVRVASTFGGGDDGRDGTFTDDSGVVSADDSKVVSADDSEVVSAGVGTRGGADESPPAAPEAGRR